MGVAAGPYVTFVTYGRNDGYAPAYVQRVSRATACLAGQLERAGVDAEIIVVDWNPPPDRPPLLDVIGVPKTLRHVAIRGLTVDPSHHDRFLGSQERGFHAGEAANAGIRRARGRFVTPKASDTFFSPPTIAMLAGRDLDENTMYRIDRHDVAIDDESIWNLDDEALLARLGQLPSTPHAWIEQSAHWNLRNLHTNACGDFTLMDIRHWQRLRGNPRDETALTLDIDSLVLHAAAAIGVRERRWPDTCRVYKPSHGNLHGTRVIQMWAGWQRTLDKFLSEKIGQKAAYRARLLFDYPRRKVRGVDSIIGPSIERNFVQPASGWARGSEFQPSQPENWGLADVTLEERILCRAAWEPSRQA